MTNVPENTQETPAAPETPEEWQEPDSVIVEVPVSEAETWLKDYPEAKPVRTLILPLETIQGKESLPFIDLPFQEGLIAVSMPPETLTDKGNPLPLPPLGAKVRGGLLDLPDAVRAFGVQRTADAIVHVLVQTLAAYASEEETRARAFDLPGALTRAVLGFIHPDMPADEEGTHLSFKALGSAQEKEWGIGCYLKPLPPRKLPDALSLSPSLPARTSQEFDALNRAAAHGKTGEGWRSDEQSDARIYENKQRGVVHHISVGLTPQQKDRGLGMGSLEQLTARQDADCAFVLLTVCGTLAPPPGVDVPEGMTPSAWLSIEDVAEKVNPNYRVLPANEREQVRRRVWDYLQFGAAARVVGSRSVPYYDKATERTIDTRIDAPLWSFGAEQKEAAVQGALFGDVPARVEVMMSRVWLPLLTDPRLAQYLPCGELLGGIAGDKPGGAWARVVGLVLLHEWRRKPREADAKTFTITRCELLTRYPPKTGPVHELLESKDPARAVKYWCDALGCLKDSGFLAEEGEAAPGVAREKRGADGQKIEKRQGWGPEWLNADVSLLPGPKLRDAVHAAAYSLPEQTRPKFLPGSGKKRGRPPKSQPGV